MEQLFKPVFSVVRRVPVAVEVTVGLILLLIPFFTHDYSSIVIFAIWIALDCGAKKHWFLMWLTFFTAAVLALAVKTGLIGP
ncbi:hypothetical protein [Azospirillum sp. B4]|uniref:hypothetical protein n=1 Tax=Azospirillum sp. B4 TaxID=95605 RepID=UPI0005CAEAD1|nr:hypothetical protein [Azospirillum sp. B4]